MKKYTFGLFICLNLALVLSYRGFDIELSTAEFWLVYGQLPAFRTTLLLTSLIWVCPALAFFLCKGKRQAFNDAVFANSFTLSMLLVMLLMPSSQSTPEVLKDGLMSFFFAATFMVCVFAHLARDQMWEMGCQGWRDEA